MKLKNINKDALLRMRSHSLKRLARKTLILTSLTGLLIFNKDNRPLDNVVSKSTSPSFIPYENSNRKTKDDDVVNFGNQKVKEAVASRLGKSPEDPLTFGELKKITMLYLSDLDGPSELSDLKLLVNLNTLFLDNCYLNCIFLENNQELTRLFIIGGEITKSDKLPNTLTNVHMINAKCSDEVFSVPYYTEDLSIMSSYLNNLTLKNPESLKSLTYNSTSVLDLKSIASCTNLEEIDLSSSANIKNPSELFKFPNLAKVSLDDYAPIWLDADTYTKLKDSKIVHEPYDLRAECTYLDHVATNIKNSGSSSKERVAEVVKYIKGKYFYNKDADDTNKEASIIYYENTYMQNTGVLYSSDEQFDVLATLPGTVTNIKDDNILGKVVYVEYNTKLTVVYYSLQSTDLKIGDQIDQNTVIGKSGSNKLENQKKYNLLIEVYKDGNLINPLDFYEMNVNELNN